MKKAEILMNLMLMNRMHIKYCLFRTFNAGIRQNINTWVYVWLCKTKIWKKANLHYIYKYIAKDVETIFDKLWIR